METHSQETNSQEPESHDIAHELEIEAIVRLEASHKVGANWFYWIAGLSLINSIILLTKGEWSFIVGLGLTQIIDAIAIVIADENPQMDVGVRIVAFAFDVMAALVFVAFGLVARKRYTAAFMIGMAIYALDGLIFVLFADWLSFGFHLFALWGLNGGLQACRRLNALARLSKADTGPP